MELTVLHVGGALIECSSIRSVIVIKTEGGWTLMVAFHFALRALLIECDDEPSAREMLVEIGKAVQYCNPMALCTDHFLVDCSAITHVVTVAAAENEGHVLDIAFRGSEAPMQLGCRDREDGILILNMIKNHMMRPTE